jgi:hypothetical protein
MTTCVFGFPGCSASCLTRSGACNLSLSDNAAGIAAPCAGANWPGCCGLDVVVLFIRFSCSRPVAQLGRSASSSRNVYSMRPVQRRRSYPVYRDWHPFMMHLVVVFRARRDAARRRTTRSSQLGRALWVVLLSRGLFHIFSSRVAELGRSPHFSHSILVTLMAVIL